MNNPNLFEKYSFWEIFHAKKNKFPNEDEKLTAYC